MNRRRRKVPARIRNVMRDDLWISEKLGRFEMAWAMCASLVVHVLLAVILTAPPALPQVAGSDSRFDVIWATPATLPPGSFTPAGAPPPQDPLQTDEQSPLSDETILAALPGQFPVQAGGTDEPAAEAADDALELFEVIQQERPALTASAPPPTPRAARTPSVVKSPQQAPRPRLQDTSAPEQVPFDAAAPSPPGAAKETSPPLAEHRGGTDTASQRGDNPAPQGEPVRRPPEEDTMEIAQVQLLPETEPARPQAAQEGAPGRTARGASAAEELHPEPAAPRRQKDHKTPVLLVEPLKKPVREPALREQAARHPAPIREEPRQPEPQQDPHAQPSSARPTPPAPAPAPKAQAARAQQKKPSPANITHRPQAPRQVAAVAAGAPPVRTDRPRSGAPAPSPASRAAAGTDQREAPKRQPKAAAVPEQTAAVPDRPQAKKGPALAALRGDLKLVLTGATGIKVSVRFRDYPRSRRNGNPARSETRDQQPMEPFLAAAGEATRVALIKSTQEGVYTFSAEAEESTGARASFILKIYESSSRERSVALGTRTISGVTVLVKILMPEAVLWDDAAAFTGSMEDSDSETKFNADNGLFWKEFRE